MWHYVKIILVGWLLIVAMLLASNPTWANDSKPEVILRLQGSNTIGAKLAPALAIAFLKQTLKAGEVHVKSMGNNELRLVTKMPDRTIAIEISSHGSSTSFAGLAAGNCDIGMASRPIKNEEKNKLTFLGNMATMSSEHILGLDGIAVIVHPDNPISRLTISNLKDIFSGKIKDWSELSTRISGPITVHARNNQSGTYDTFKSLVLGKKTRLVSTAKRYESNSRLSDHVAESRLAIGFTGLPYILQAKALSIADKGAAYVAPTANSVATEDYPLSRRLFLYSPPYPENIYTRFFIDFALSESGQRIVANVGFVGQNIKTFPEIKQIQAKAQRIDAVARLKEDTKNAHRVSLNFRFQPASFDLDGRSERDLIRLANFLRYRNDEKILLIGFTDSSGDYNANLNLANLRARIVYDRLKRIGATGTYHILSAGEELPVASNDNAKGREKNRRVEVWLAPLKS